MTAGGRIAPAGRAPSPWAARAHALAFAAGAAAFVVAGAAHSRSPQTPPALAAGRTAGMLALALVMLQFALAGRARWLDRAFGLDRLYRFHAVTGVAAGAIASTHPLLVLWPRANSPIGASTGGPAWAELIGAAALALVWIVLATTLGRTFLGLSYQAWRWVHGLTFVVVAVVVVHAFARGTDLASGGWVRRGWAIAAGGYLAGFVWVKFIRPRRLPWFVVRSVSKASHNTVSVELAPADGRTFSYLPGQFVFVRFASPRLPGEEHPFTLSSSPTRADAASLTIKQVGDFTRKVDLLRPGDRVRVHGPFGRFSHLLLARQGEPLVMIAGGIGVTPMLSMLRFLADAGDARAVKLIWANRTEADIVFRDEIEQLRARLPGLAVHHVLSRQADWAGPKGRLDAGMLDRLLTPADRSGRVFLCGPPAMMRSVAGALRRLRFPPRKIHSERFALS